MPYACSIKSIDAAASAPRKRNAERDHAMSGSSLNEDIMNATVTRSATKTAASKDTGKKAPVPVKTKTAGSKTAKAGSA
ncbi:hypothetical protein, partial [Noviherbaspirillum sp.]|uniref:hypothetical protein n=1 Tax=Noviherbaspirillum sp. TaxID=1926288 RepID=UPI002FE3D01D